MPAGSTGGSSRASCGTSFPTGVFSRVRWRRFLRDRPPAGGAVPHQDRHRPARGPRSASRDGAMGPPVPRGSRRRHGVRLPADVRRVGPRAAGDPLAAPGHVRADAAAPGRLLRPHADRATHDAPDLRRRGAPGAPLLRPRIDDRRRRGAGGHGRDPALDGPAPRARHLRRPSRPRAVRRAAQKADPRGEPGDAAEARADERLPAGARDGSGGGQGVRDGGEVGAEIRRSERGVRRGERAAHQPLLRLLPGRGDARLDRGGAAAVARRRRSSLGRGHLRDARGVSRIRPKVLRSDQGHERQVQHIADRAGRIGADLPPPRREGLPRIRGKPPRTRARCPTVAVPTGLRVRHRRPRDRVPGRLVLLPGDRGRGNGGGGGGTAGPARGHLHPGGRADRRDRGGVGGGEDDGPLPAVPLLRDPPRKDPSLRAGRPRDPAGRAARIARPRPSGYVPFLRDGAGERRGGGRGGRGRAVGDRRGTVHPGMGRGTGDGRGGAGGAAVDGPAPDGVVRPRAGAGAARPSAGRGDVERRSRDGGPDPGSAGGDPPRADRPRRRPSAVDGPVRRPDHRDAQGEGARDGDPRRIDVRGGIYRRLYALQFEEGG